MGEPARNLIYEPTTAEVVELETARMYRKGWRDTADRSRHRDGIRQGRRGDIPSGGATIVTPLTILGSGVKLWVRGDMGITIGTGVSAWADQSGNGNNFAQGTGSAQPLYSALGGPNGTPFVAGNAVDKFIDSTGPDLVPPGTTPFYIWMVARQPTALLNTSFLRGTGSGSPFIGNGAAATVQMFNGGIANTNAGFTANTWMRLEFQFRNAAGASGDYSKCGPTQVNIQNAMNTDPSGGIRLFRQNAAGTQWANLELLELVVYQGAVVTAPQRSSMDTYCTGRYGAGLV